MANRNSEDEDISKGVEHLQLSVEEVKEIIYQLKVNKNQRTFQLFRKDLKC